MRNAILLLCAVLASPVAPADFLSDYRAAMAARVGGDFAAMERHLRAALAARPGHPTALYRLAVAQGLQGRKQEAFDTLQILADMRLSYEAGKDPDFEALRAEPRLAELDGQFERNRRPVGTPSQVFRVFIPDYIPEGLAFDDDTGSFFIGGARRRLVRRVDWDGTVTGFVAPGSAGMFAPLGMVADSRRRLLWVVHAGVPEMEDPDARDLGRSGIVAFDLDSGRARRRALLEAPGKHRLGHLALMPDASLYVSDSESGRLYHFNTVSGDFTPRTAAGELTSPRGLALSDDRSTLYVADYVRGLFAFDLEKRRLAPLAVPERVCPYGIEGLYRHGNDLIAVQTGVHPQRIVRFRLDGAGRRVVGARVLAASLPEFDGLAQGVVDGDRFVFIANSQWGRFDERHRLPPVRQLRSPLVMRLLLDDD